MGGAPLGGSSGLSGAPSADVAWVAWLLGDGRLSAPAVGAWPPVWLYLAAGARCVQAFQEGQRPLQAPLRLAHCFYWSKGVGSTARIRRGETQGPSCRQELPSHCHGAQRWGRPGSSSGCRSTRQPRLHHRVTHQTSHLAFVVGGRRVGGAVSAGQRGANFQLLLVKSWHHFHERTETWAELFLLFAGRSVLVLLRARSPQAPLRSSSLQSSLLSEIGIRSQAAGVSACWDPAPGSRALKSIWNSLPCNVNGHGEGSEIPAKPLP